MKEEYKVDLQDPAKMSCGFGGTGNQSCPQGAKVLSLFCGTESLGWGFLSFG